jgi:hypothetical protein
MRPEKYRQINSGSGKFICPAADGIAVVKGGPFHIPPAYPQAGSTHRFIKTHNNSCITSLFLDLRCNITRTQAFANHFFHKKLLSQ